VYCSSAKGRDVIVVGVLMSNWQVSKFPAKK